MTLVSLTSTPARRAAPALLLAAVLCLGSTARAAAGEPVAPFAPREGVSRRAAVAICLAAPSPDAASASQEARADTSAAARAYEKGVELARDRKYREAVEQFRRSHDLAKSAGDRAAQVRAMRHAGSLYQYRLDEHELALAAYESALEAARASADRRLEAEALGDVAGARKLLGDTDASVRSYEAALAIYQALEDYPAVVMTLANIGEAYRAGGQTGRADEYRARAAEVRARHDVPHPILPVSGGVLAGKILTKVEPSFPEAARRAGASGKVVVEVMVGVDGRVESAKPISGAPELVEAAVDAVKQWTFHPTTLSGQPARVRGTVTFNFIARN